MQVRWNNSLSHLFSVTNGVRQGGVLSPILFTVYLDDLFSSLKSLGIGCHWDGLFVGAVSYADDIALPVPSPSALRLMLKHCEEFAISRGLSFNASKTQLIRFGTQPSHLCPAIISFSGVSLPFTDTVVHLGHTLSFDNSDTADILFKARDLVRKANLMLHTFSAADPLVKSCLFKFYCLSLYACGTSPVTHSALLKFLSITFFNTSGISHVIAILGFCTSQLYCPAFSTWFNPGLPLSFPVHCLVPLMLSRPFFVTQACWLLLKLGLRPCLVINSQCPIITNMASVLKLSVIFIFMEIHQRSMT